MRLSTGFVLLMLVLGLRFGPFGPVAMLLFVASVLYAHELPRALLARSLGRSATVTISVQGGNTDVTGGALQGAARVAFVSIGSVANVLVAVAAYALSRHAPATRLGWTLLGLAEAHAAWGIAQALPILPFQAGRAVARRLGTSHRFMHAAGSLAVVGLVFVVGRMKAIALVPFSVLAVVSVVRAATEAHAASTDEHAGIGAAAGRAETCLGAGHPILASSLAAEALRTASSTEQQKRLWKTMFWAAVGRQDPFAAHAALDGLPAEAVDVHLIAAYLGCCNRLEEATCLLEDARQLGYRTPETTKLLVDLHYRRGDTHAIRELVRTDSELLSSADRTTLESALSTAIG